MADASRIGGISRRRLLAGAAMTGAMCALERGALAQNARPKAAGKLKISLFSKVLQWTDVAEAAAIAKDLGYDALDLTVRPRGHVLPDRVGVDLPKAVEAVRKAGLEVSMISTEITSVESPYAEEMLKAASQLGIRHYRWGGLRYKGSRRLPDQLNDLKPQMKALAALNQRHGMCGMYHTHSGLGMIGGPIWDLWLLFQQLDPRWIGMNYDIGHATVEGGFGGWQASAELVQDSMKGIALKDFRWPLKGGGTAEYGPEWCAIGEGVVDFAGFFRIVKANHFDGPIQMHFESTDLGGAENGEKTIRIPRQQLLAAIRKDLDRVRGVMRGLDLV